MNHAHLFSFCLCLCATSATAAAYAQAPASEAASTRADDLTHQGVELSKKHQWAEAEALFREAWSLKRSYDIGGNLGVAEAALGKWRDAAEHLAFALRTFPANGKPGHRDLLKEKLAAARREVAALSVDVNVPGAEVSVDGVSAGAAPVPDEIFVEPGSHTVQAKRAGYLDAKQTVQAAKGSAQTVTLALPPAPPPPLTTTGSVPQSTPPPWRPGPAVLIPAGALAAGGIAIGAGLTVAANGKASDVHAIQGSLKQGGASYPCAGASGATATTCSKLRDAATAQQTLSDAAFASFVTGGAFALAAAGLGIWSSVTPKDTGPKRGVHVVPVVGVGAGAGGVVVTGRW
jgi:hypothetical protein